MEKIELINMALFEIGRECQIVDALSKEFLRHIEVIEAKGKEVPDTFRKLKEQHDDMLSDIHKMLRDVMEEIGEYMNAHDIVQGVDVAINKTIYDLVYERKLNEETVWGIYNFINEWKAGNHGEIPLSEALKADFDARDYIVNAGESPAQ